MTVQGYELHVLLLNNTYFCANYEDIHLDMKLACPVSRTFQERSLSELEILHHLFDLERT